MLTIGIIYIKHLIIRLFKVLLIIIPFIVLFFLYQPKLDLLGVELINPIYNLFDWWVLLILYIISICLLSIVFFISLILHFTFQVEKTQKRVSRLTHFFIPALVEYLYSEKYDSDKEKIALYRTLSRFTNKKKHIEALFIAITRIQEAVTIDNSDKYKILIKELNLKKALTQFLYSFNLSDRIIAIKVISYLRIRNTDYIKRIEDYSNSNNFALRNEAYTGLIRLMEHNNQLSAFIGNKHKLSLLDINVIVNAVLRNTQISIDYLDLLSSPLDRKVITGLLLAKSRYREDSRSLILILNHIGSSSPLLNSLAWDAFLTLVPQNEGMDIILDSFENEPDDIKLMILKNSHGTNDSRLYGYLKNKAIPNGSLQVKIEAMRILFNEKFENLSSLLNADDQYTKMAFQEVTDININ